MSSDLPRQGLLDTNILILRRWLDPAGLPEEMAISAITLAELSAGPHEVRGNNERTCMTSTPSGRGALRSCSAPRASSTRCRLTPRRPASTAG